MSDSKYMFEQATAGVMSVCLKITLCAVAITVLEESARAQQQPPFVTDSQRGKNRAFNIDCSK
jgi:hypothetical protein